MLNIKQAQSFGLGFNAVFEKYMFLIIPLSVLTGFLLYEPIRHLLFLVPYLFAYVTFVMALGCNIGQIGTAVRKPLPILLVFVLAHIVAPLAAYEAGLLLFGPGSPLIIGMVLFAIIPLGVSSVIWIGLSGGYVALTLAMIVFDSALAPFVVPAAMSLFFGADIRFDFWAMAADLLLIVVVPTIIGIALNELSKGRAKPWSAPVAAPTSKLAFTAVVMINAAAIAPYVLEMKREVMLLIPVVVLLVVFCYALGFVAALLFRDPAMVVTLSYSSGMRNVSLGIVIAMAYFEPLAAVPVVMGILIQQPMATLNRWFVEKYIERRLAASTGSVQKPPVLGG